MAPKRSKATAAAEAPEVDAKKPKTGVAVGDDLPEFELETDESTDSDRKTISSRDIVSESGSIFFFYPKANTGGCTKQAIGFNDNAEELKTAGYKVYGMSADKPKSQANWKKKYDLKYTLLSDPSYEVLKKLGVTKGTKGINRSHIVVAKGGKIQDVRIGISPGDSFAEAVKTAKEKGEASEDVKVDLEEKAEEAKDDEEEKKAEEAKDEEKAEAAEEAKGDEKAEAAEEGGDEVNGGEDEEKA